MITADGQRRIVPARLDQTLVQGQHRSLVRLLLCYVWRTFVGTKTPRRSFRKSAEAASIPTHRRSRTIAAKCGDGFTERVAHESGGHLGVRHADLISIIDSWCSPQRQQQ